jgi:hypothetical protein
VKLLSPARDQLVLSPVLVITSFNWVTGHIKLDTGHAKLVTGHKRLVTGHDKKLNFSKTGHKINWSG